MAAGARIAAGRRAFSPAQAGMGILSILATVFAIEVACRLWQLWEHARYEKAMREVGSAATLRLPARVELHHLVRLSDNPRIVYELLPNLSVHYPAHTPLQTNEMGFRGPPYPVEKREGTVRIVGLGDSLMFGWCVREEETFLAYLREDLGRRRPEIAWEVINMAVPGYNTVMEVETLKEKGLPYRPDVVVLNLVGNDADLPNFVRAKEDYLDTSRSFLWQTASSRLKGRRVAIEGELAVAPKAHDRGGFEGDPEWVGEPYRDMVGLVAFRKALSRLKSMSKKHKFRVVVLSHPLMPGFAKRACADLGLPVLDTLPAFIGYMRDHGIRKLEGSDLELSPTDHHPSPLGHRIIANVIRKHLEKSGIAQQLVERRRTKAPAQPRVLNGEVRGEVPEEGAVGPR